ncbi:DUF5979 domain-containing protein [Arcanobacterium bovis]|uniref:DUF5979 domain-containing protein n=1 Tax=Arcanobacterium bovis TaxID=2529275 RepID=A0A4Q9UZS9_9ACTO|nr:DUF5979 domain-containing protein [Arcanobacterium bovis]TBW21510.1 hypothetical protein EZJ44_06100 [Arcanobacterium bovis]
MFSKDSIQSPAKKLWASFLSFVFIVVLLLPVSPWSPNRDKADAAAITYDLGDCAMRMGTGAAANLANSFCFIDFAGMIGAKDSTVHVKRLIGDMTLEFDLSWTNNGVVTPQVTAESTQWDSSSSFGQTINSNQTFVAYSGDTQSPIVKTKHLPPTYTFSFNNVVLRDAKGATLPSFKLNVLDAEQSPGTESWAIMDNDTTTNKTTFNKVVQTGFAEPCNVTSSSGRDFYCQGYATTGTYKGIAIATIDSPTQFQVEKYSASGWGGFAIAISIGRVAGTYTANTSYELAETGQATTFDHRVYSKTSTSETLIPGTNGSTFTVYNRPFSNSLTPTDKQVFKSTGSGTQSQYVFDRYTPVWTCTAGTSAPVTIKEGQVPAGYTLVNDRNTATSILTADNATDAPLECNVDWQSKFQPSTFDFSKLVTGNAANFTDISTRSFDLNYTCTNSAFATAYPSIPLSGKVTLQAGASAQIKNIPAGTPCTVTESFPGGAQPAPPGVNLTLTWTGGTPSADTLPNVSTTLATSTSVAATNNYTYRAGSITLSKNILGDPVGDFTYPRHYDFSLTCVGTTVQNRTVGFDINPSGGAYSGSVNISDIPVARDCRLTPLTGLSPTEVKKYDFVSRNVTFNGTAVTKNSDGSYSFTLADYAQGGTPTTGTVHIDTTYAYQLRDVKVIKELAGPASNSKDLEGKTFPVQYKCTWGASGQYSKTGTLNITTDTANPATISGVAVDASCIIYEDTVAATPNTILTGTTVSAADANDVTVTKTNDEAKTQAILKVSSATDSTQNRVLITNTYDYKLGTVDITKVVNKNGLTVTLPSTFSINFDCGTRSVVAADGSVVSVPLVGTVMIAGGETKRLKAQVTDATLDPKINDQSGYLGVPYANKCSFTEDAPQISTSGVLWQSDVDSQSFTVTADSTTKTITNNFTAAGNGLTIQARVVAGTELAQPITFNVACKDSGGTTLILDPQYAQITLSKATPSVTIPASKVPEGSTCTLTEPTPDPGTRTTTGGMSYPITRSAGLHIAATGSNPEVNQTFGNLAPINSNTLTIGASTVAEINLYYAYVTSPVKASKVVAFDPATQQYISDARKDIKRNREFSVTLKCTYPDGITTANASGTVVSTQPEITLTDEVPVGSSCTIAEGATTTAAGVDVKQEVAVNGGANANVSTTFTVKDTSNSAMFTNTYSRRLAPVVLNKRAVLPGSIHDQYAAAGQSIPFHTHQFTMDCHDPETGTGSTGVLLGTFNGTITGEGSYQFDNVPVGVDCHIKGDQFGQLDLSLPGANGVQLKAYVKPKQVKWVVDKNDGTAVIDTDFPGDVTESAYFSTLDAAADGTVTNVVDIENTYEYIQTKIQMTKKVVGAAGDLALLSPDQTYNFNFQCEGVGYNTSTIGTGSDTLSNSLVLSTFGTATDNGDGTVTRLYTSPQVTVPAGAWCDFDEKDPVGTPAQLVHSMDQQVIKKYAALNSDPNHVESWDFVDRYTHRLVPVGIATLHNGYIDGAFKDGSGNGYTYKVTCDDPAKTSFTHSVSFADARVGLSVSDPGVPDAGQTLQLPAGANCTISYAGSPSLVPSAPIEVTAGDRAPFMRFGTWTGTSASASNPTQPWRDINAADVTTDMKNYSFAFAIPADLTATNNVAMTVAAQTIYIRDTMDVTITKESFGAAGAGASFSFTSDCLPSGETATVKSGESFTMHNVAVDRTCIVTEASLPGTLPELGIESQGDGIIDAWATNVSATETDPASRYMQFTTAPVTNASDLSQSGPYWNFVLSNRYPSIDIEKTIDGPLVSSNDGVVLSPTATSMTVHYVLSNNGGLPVDSFALSDPSLAGRTIANGSQTITVGADGSIDPLFCGIDNNAMYTMQPGDSLTCSFTVQLTEPVQTPLNITGAVKVDALANGWPVSDSDGFGAQRVWMTLPQAGAISLVVVIMTGVGVVVYGLWKNRKDDDDKETTLPLDA